MSKPLIGLVMIVKNEAEQLARYLPEVASLVGSWTICDTGSTDDTKTVVRDALRRIPGRLFDHKWRDFGYNLTLAHARARGTARWLLWLHADMTVEAAPKFEKFLRNGGKNRRVHAWWIDVVDQGGDRLGYRLPLLMRGSMPWEYIGPTHEYLKIKGRGVYPFMGLTVLHHQDGANRVEKANRDIELLTPGFNEGEPRAVFYMAQTLRYAGKLEPARVAYEMRARMEDTWEEERWYAGFQAARLAGDIDALLVSWRERPYRHEPLTAAARLVAQMGGFGDVLFLERSP